LPAFNWLPDDPNHLTNSDIDRAASELRQFLGIGNRPIKNLTWLLENNGIYVIEGLWYDEFIDAFSGWFNSDQEKAIIMLGKEERLPSRQRFSLAHELGHLILHKPVISDSDDERVPLKIVERHANRFASSFLLPPESFNADLERGQDLRAFLSLKPKWNVSCRAMIYCAAERGYLSDDRKATLFKLANGKWGSKSEPLEDSRFESPYQAREALKLLSSNKVMALEDWKTHCGLRVEELLDMVGCEDLLQDDSNIIEIKSLGNVRDIGII